MPVIREKYGFLFDIETVPSLLPAGFVENVGPDEMLALRGHWKKFFLSKHWSTINGIYGELNEVIRQKMTEPAGKK
jgi:hypothetical protein